MSWMAKLYETYEQGIGLELPDEQKLMPVSHTLQNAHINITIDANAVFRKAQILEKTQIVLPATEKSAGRSSGEAPHPLADKIQYVAKDYPEFGGRKKSYFTSYEKLLSDWSESKYSNAKVQAVCNYIKKGCVVKDLVGEKILYADDKGTLIRYWPHKDDKEKPPPLIFKVLPTLPKEKRVKKDEAEVEQGDALVCWSVEIEGDPVSDTWRDKILQQSWILFDAQTLGKNNLCYVTGVERPEATNHPAKLRHTGDKAKLISANDNSGFTFRGRFIEGEHVANIGFEITQKAHNSLRWLISRQGYRNGDQVVVAWAISGKPIPKLMVETSDLEDFEEITQEEESFLKTEKDLSADMGQRFAHSLKRYIAGYHAKLDPTESVVIMALDSATPGRMAVTYYRDFMAKDYLETIEKWHREFAWFQLIQKSTQKNGKTKKEIAQWVIGAPSPKNVINAVYGKDCNESLKKNLYERILPCIAEGRTFPWNLVELAIRRAGNRNIKRLPEQYSNQSSENNAWINDLCVACALYRGFFNRNKRRDYSMALETENTSRDYLYGRLLAVAERIEEMAMIISKEPARSTQASRLMQRFADHPFSTWSNIEKGLGPYQQRLKSKNPHLESAYKKLLDDIYSLFLNGDFAIDRKLTGEYLLSFHCQRKWLREHKLEKGQWILKENEELVLETQKGE